MPFKMFLDSFAISFRPLTMAMLQETIPVLCGLAVYQVLQLLLQRLMQHFSPTFYARLQGDSTRRLRPYLVFPIGILLTCFTTPICIQAFRQVDMETDDFHTNRPFTNTEKLCLGTRGVLWISELPLLSYSASYVLHHVFSLASLFFFVVNDVPRRLFYLIYASLVTELFSDTVAILRLHGLRPDNSRLQYGFTLLNALSLVLIRVVPALGYALYTFMPADRLDQWGYILAVLLQCCFLLYIAWKQLSSLSLVELKLHRPGAHIRVLGRYDVTLYSLFLGFAMAAAQFLTAVLFSSFREVPTTDAEIRSMAVTGLEMAMAGLFGASNGRLLLGPGQSSYGHKTDQKTSSSKWFQAGVVSALLWLFLSTRLEPSLDQDKRLMFAAVGMSIPIGEGIGRIGCYFAGCCGSARPGSSQRGRYGEVQLLASVMNLVAYLALVSTLARDVLTLSETGLLAVAINAMVRLVVEPLRGDLNGETKLSSTRIVALCQLAASLYVFSGERQGRFEASPRSLIETAAIAAVFWVMVLSLRLLWVSLHQDHAGEFKRSPFSKVRRFMAWITSPTMVCCLVAMVIFGVEFWEFIEPAQPRPARSNSGEMSEAYRQVWNILTNPSLCASSLIMCLMPVLVG